MVGGPDQPELPRELAAGFYVRPTVVSGVDLDAAIFREDITGPVVTVSSYAREDDLAGVLNQHALAPRTRIWIGDHARGLSLARRLRGPSVLVGPPASGDVPGYAHSSEPMPSRRLLLCSSDS